MEVDYDRELIAQMLGRLIGFGDRLTGYTYQAVHAQIEALRRADQADAEGVRTVCGDDGATDAKLADKLAALADRWDERARLAHPFDAMLINKHARELSELLAGHFRDAGEMVGG